MALSLGAPRLGRSANAGSAFDFDVVSDVPPPPVRRPDPAPEEHAAAARPSEGAVDRGEADER